MQKDPWNQSRLADHCPHSLPVCSKFTLVASGGATGTIVDAGNLYSTYNSLAFGSATSAIVFSLTSSGQLTDSQGQMYGTAANGANYILRYTTSADTSVGLLQCQTSSLQQLVCSIGSAGQNIFGNASGGLIIETSARTVDYPAVRFNPVILSSRLGIDDESLRSHSRWCQLAEDLRFVGKVSHANNAGRKKV